MSFGVHTPALASPSAVSAPQVADAPDPDSFTVDAPDITFKSGVAIGGHSHVVFHKDGRVEFESHFHDSGAIDYVYSISWVVAASDGTLFTLHRIGKCEGHVIGKSGRNSNKDETVVNPQVTAHWAALTKAHLARVKTDVKPDFNGLVDTLKEAVDDVQEGMKAAQEVYATVSTVVALFA